MKMPKGLPKKWFNWAIAHRKTLGASKAFKQAWAHARGHHSSPSSRKARHNPIKRVKTTMARRRYFRRKGSSGLSIRGFMRKVVLPAAPHLLSNTGMPELGYNVFAPGMSMGQRLQFLGTNELLLFTGYDAYSRQWNWKAPLVNYGSIFLPTLIGKVVKMITGRRR